jgi:hypothetical protein
MEEFTAGGRSDFEGFKNLQQEADQILRDSRIYSRSPIRF